MPTGIPLPRLAVSPMTLAMKALRVRYSFSTTPLRMVFNSGMPDPAGKNKKTGEIKWYHPKTGVGEEHRLTGDGELTNGLWGNEVAEERGKRDKDHGIGNPGEVLERHIALELPVYPLIG